MAVDTLKLYERLVKANVAPEASREIAEAISENTRISVEGLSTKEDIARLEGKMATKEDVAALKTDIAALRGETGRLEKAMATKEDLANLKTEIANLKTEIANLRFELIKWIVGVGIAGFTALFALLKNLQVI